jgi:hypothetical protein
MARIEMQNHESQSAVGRHGAEKAVQGVDAACRCADPHDWLVCFPSAGGGSVFRVNSTILHDASGLT